MPTTSTLREGAYPTKKKGHLQIQVFNTNENNAKMGKGDYLLIKQTNNLKILNFSFTKNEKLPIKKQK